MKRIGRFKVDLRVGQTDVGTGLVEYLGYIRQIDGVNVDAVDVILNLSAEVLYLNVRHFGCADVFHGSGQGLTEGFEVDCAVVIAISRQYVGVVDTDLSVGGFQCSVHGEATVVQLNAGGLVKSADRELEGKDMVGGCSLVNLNLTRFRVVRAHIQAGCQAGDELHNDIFELNLVNDTLQAVKAHPNGHLQIVYTHPFYRHNRCVDVVGFIMNVGRLVGEVVRYQ